MFWKRKSEKENEIRKKQQAHILAGIQKLTEGDGSYIHVVYSAFAYNDKNLIRDAGIAIRLHLNNYTMSQMIKLSECFRQYTSLEWSVEWRGIYLKDIKSYFEQERDYIYSLILGSFHPNGYFREHCIMNLAEYQDTLAFIILRMNDWVENVRKSAINLIIHKIETCSIHELFYASLSLNRVKYSERRDASDLSKIFDMISKRIEDEIQDIPLGKICYYDFEIRKNIYRLLFSKKILGKEKADYLLARERHSFCKTLIISGILELYECSIEQINSYLINENSNIRRKALEYKYSLIKDSWNGLEVMLLDQNSGIRELVVYILRKHKKYNVLNYYIEHLKDNNPATPIIGIGENGSKEQVNMLLPFLDYNEEKIIRITLTSLGRLMGFEGCDLYWKYLMDNRLGVSKAAYLAICNNSIHYGCEELAGAYSKNEVYHVKRYLVLLIMQENSWERLPYLLYLYDDKNLSVLQDKIRLKIIHRDMYGKINQKQSDIISKALEEKGDLFTKRIIDDIRFDLKCIMR